MKTFTLCFVAAAVTSSAVLPFNFILGLSLLFATGFVAIIITDYTRASRVLRLPATMAVGTRVERLGLAA